MGEFSVPKKIGVINPFQKDFTKNGTTFSYLKEITNNGFFVFFPK